MTVAAGTSSAERLDPSASDSAGEDQQERRWPRGLLERGSEGATSVLIEAWGERYLELSRGNMKQKHWKDVADIVSSSEDYTKTLKTDIQCKNRIDTVKKKYKLLCFYRIYFFIFLVVFFWVFRGISETQKFSIFCCSPTAIF